MEIYERLRITGDSHCTNGNEKLAVVHACKSPCHQNAVGYRGSLSSSHENYLVLEVESELFLNIIDPPVPLFKPPLFSRFLEFAMSHWNNNRELLIHCNQGESRAPSLALLFLAKGLAVIPSDSFLNARQAFEKLYPRYNPGRGIETYFLQNWDMLGSDF